MCSGDGSWTFLQLGFPIRTSPDHSSVANSPGLIAGSYVLLRLLMPRHPPCALCSLSHKHSTKTTSSSSSCLVHCCYKDQSLSCTASIASRGGELAESDRKRDISW